jgi:hypothetical protein
MRHICVVFDQGRLESPSFPRSKAEDQAQDDILGLLDRGIKPHGAGLDF